MAREEARARVIEDSETLVNMKVNDDGSINVVSTSPTPPNTTKVQEKEQLTLAKNGGTDSFNWTIPNGETFTLLGFIFTGSGTSGTTNPLQAKAELYYRPGGSGVTTGEVRIESLYLANQSFTEDKFNDGDLTFTGDGTAVIEVDVINWGKDVSEFEPQFRGYY